MIEIGSTAHRGMIPGSVVDARYAAMTVIVKNITMAMIRGIAKMRLFSSNHGKETAHSKMKRVTARTKVRMVPR